MDPNVEEFNRLDDGSYPGGVVKLPEDCVSLAYLDNSGCYETEVHILAKNDQGYWCGEAGGCSCYTSATVVGPFPTKEEALANISDWRRGELIELLRGES